MKWLLGLVTLAYSAGLCHAQSAPSIESTAGGSILITIPRYGKENEVVITKQNKIETYMEM